VSDDLILLGHGSGGLLSHRLLEELIVPALSGAAPSDRNDAAVLDPPPGRLAFTTDSHVVDPIFFPGGDIGDLAVNGTVNDLAMMGARPLWLSVGLVLEEGLRRADLARVLASMKRAAGVAGVRIVTGDTKVVPRRKADKIFLNTAGVGVLEHDLAIHGANARPGDRILVSGTVADHGVAILAARERLDLGTTVASDTAAVNGLVAALAAGIGGALHVLRDPTRGGVATTLKEIALQSGVDLRLREEAVPVRPAVRELCGVLGLDPLHVANEGKLLAFVAPEAAERALGILRRDPLGADAAIVGEVTAGGEGRIALEGRDGRVRLVEMPSGELLPRIC
jgi:hydrogenase expression/formation protein HypE